MVQTSTLFLLLISFVYLLPAQPVDIQEMRKNLGFQQPDLFGYQDFDTKMLKINVLDLIQQVGEDGIMGKIQVAYEHKVKPSWSLNTELHANYFFAYGEPGNSKLELQGGGMSLQIGPRYYFDLSRRIRGLESKNNFSANYIALNVATRLFELRRGVTATDNARYLYTDNFSISPLFGIQRRIMKWIYVDFNLGGRVSYGDPLRTRLFFPKDAVKVWQVYPVTTLALGIAI